MFEFTKQELDEIFGNNKDVQSRTYERIFIYQKQSSQALTYTSADQDRRLTPISDQFGSLAHMGQKLAPLCNQ